MTIEEVNEKIKSYSEVMVYCFIDECGAFIWRMDHDMAHPGRIPQEDHAAIDADIIRVRKQQILAVRQLTRFEIKIPLDEDDRPTEDYWKWFRWWDKWKRGMNDDEWRRIDAMLSGNMSEDQIQQCRPNGKWQDPVTEKSYETL